MDDTHGFDPVLNVLFETHLNQACINTFAPPLDPGKLNVFAKQSKLLSQLFPQGRKVPRLVHQNRISGRKRVDQSSFPGTGT